MRSNQLPVSLTVVFGLAMMTGGCASPPPRTGFISDYASLERVSDSKALFVSPQLAQYQSFMVDPVQIREVKDPPVLTPEERAEIANYFRDSLVTVLRKNNYMVTNRAGAGTARVRFAITDIKESAWWLNLHPASKLSGVGTGGASMEGEVIDSVSGRQLGAVVKSGTGNQFELDTFSKLDDVKDVIDTWAKEAEKRLRELREARTAVRYSAVEQRGK